MLQVLAPINGPLGNITEYFDTIVAPVYQKLLDTFLGRPDKTWWNDIVLRQAKVRAGVAAKSITWLLRWSKCAPSSRRWWSGGTGGWSSSSMGRRIRR